MSKVIAIGGGRYDDGEIENVLEYIAKSAGKENPSVIFIPTAGMDDINGDEPIRDTFVKYGCTFEPLFLTDESLTIDDIRSTILGADIIYVGGGNVEFMMNVWNKTGASDVLREAYEKGIIMSGYSAGADCWFQEAYDDCGPDHSFMFCDCLGIFPYSCCPHFQGGNWPSFREAVKTRSVSGFGIENGAAVVFEDGKVVKTLQGNDDGDVWFLDIEKGHEAIKINPID